MSLPLLPTVLWQSVPYGDKDAFLDWELAHWLTHIEVAKKTNTRVVPLDKLRDDAFAHSLMHRDASSALNLAVDFNFADFDLNDQDSYYDFMLAHSDHHQLLQNTAGL